MRAPRYEQDASIMGWVRVASRPIPPQWGSLRFRPPICTYAPRGPSVRVDELAQSRKMPARKALPLFSVSRHWVLQPPRRTTSPNSSMTCWYSTTAKTRKETNAQPARPNEGVEGGGEGRRANIAWVGTVSLWSFIIDQWLLLESTATTHPSMPCSHPPLLHLSCSS